MLDITDFMLWFINQVISIIGQAFTLIDNIQIAGTSLLKIMIVIFIIGTLLPVLLTITQGITETSISYGYPAKKKKKKG